MIFLEQYGIEVSRAVGEEPVNSAQAATPATAIPAPRHPKQPVCSRSLIRCTSQDNQLKYEFQFPGLPLMVK